MNKAINIVLMILVGLIFAYSTAHLIPVEDKGAAYQSGYMMGRAIGGILIGFIIVCLFQLIARRKPILSKGAMIAWWILFIVLSVMGLIGNRLPPAN